MSFDPSADINVANSPEAMADMRAQAEDDAALDEKYSNPEVLKSQQQEIRNALYKREGTPLTIEQQESNTELFNDMYATDLELILSPEYTDRIRDNFTWSGDIEWSIFQVLQSLDMANEDREELSDLIAEYIDPRITSQRIQENLNSEDWIEVKPWMNASYINAHLWSNRHIDLNEDANSLKVWSALRFNWDETTLLQNDSQIGTLNEENGDLPESARKEFWENRYASLIELHTVHSGENISPLHDISVEQVAEIEAWYMDGMDIVDAMTSILWENHEAVKQAQDLDNPDTIDQRRQDMFEDCDVPLEDRVNPETGSCRDPFTNLISENYIRILWPEWEPDTKASLILASQISANKIIENKHTFTRSKEFDEAYDRISAGEENPEQMQQDLMLIYNTVNNAEWIRWKWRQTETQRTQSARQKALILDGDFQNIQRLLLQTNSETNTTLTENQVDTSAQNTDIQWWEVFSAGKIDIAMTWNEAWWETA
jgi:hypothetical protein